MSAPTITIAHISDLHVDGSSHKHERVLDLSAPPMLAFHIVADDGRVTTHYRALPG